MAKKYSGYTDKTMKSLVMGSGAFFKNFDMETDTFESAVTGGKLIGATRGGGSFEAKPEIRAIEIDGVAGKAKGMESLDSWSVNMGANIIEITKDNLALALGTSTITDVAGKGYDKITANNVIAIEDYVENITFVGTLSGEDKPIIIQVYNALNIEGLSLTTKEKDEMVIAMKFEGHYDAADLDTPPFAIFYPKPISPPTGA